MLFRNTVAAYGEDHMEHTNTLCAQNGGTYSDHWASKGLMEQFREESIYPNTCAIQSTTVCSCQTSENYRIRLRYLLSLAPAGLERLAEVYGRVHLFSQYAC
jgi:hypothetical protein